ncbi:MAG: TIGR00730 family Rossman fold protein [Janthinobacterium lividum]
MTSSSHLSIAVFCGSRFGNNPAFRTAGEQLGRALADTGKRLVYGGGQVGLMGVIADAVIKAGGDVFGVIPAFLQRREVAHQGPVALVVTDTMHDRKRRMFEAADAFVIMPGGIGTFDEAIEITTWAQLGLHDKPIFVVDIAGWARPYLAMIEAAIETGFAPAETRNLYQIVPDVPALMHHLATLTRPAMGQPERV